MVESALVGVGVLAASVLVAVVIGLLLSRGVERLFRRGRRDSPSDEPESETSEPGGERVEPGGERVETEEERVEAGADTDEAPADTREA